MACCYIRRDIKISFIHSYRSMPLDLSRTLCIIRSRKNFGALCAPHGRTNPTLYLCPGPSLLQPLGPPLRTVVFHHLNVFCTSGSVLWPGVVVSTLSLPSYRELCVSLAHQDGHLPEGTYTIRINSYTSVVNPLRTDIHTYKSYADLTQILRRILLK